MSTHSELKKVMNRDMAIKELDKGHQLTAVLQAHVGTVLNDGTGTGTGQSQFGFLFEEINRTFKLSRELLAASNQNLVESKPVRVNKKRKKDVVQFKENQRRRKYSTKRTELTPTPDHDGYQWKKYGQKPILNKPYPRCYYRCTYSKEHKCMATQTVQQYNDTTPPLFEITYFNEHTCNIAISKSESSKSQKVSDFSAKSTEEPSFGSKAACVFRKEEEDEIMLQCLKNVINGNTQTMSNSNESTVSSIDEDRSPMEIMLPIEDETDMDEMINVDLQWFEYYYHDDLNFALDGTLDTIWSF